MKKIITTVTALVMMVAALTVSASAKSAEKTVSVRIEGLTSNIYYDTVTTTTDNVADLLNQINSEVDSVDITIQDGSYGAYVVAVNEETEACKGGYEGWMFTVNGKVSDYGISETKIKDNDTVCLYFADPFGAGFQYPEVDITDVNEGILVFTSEDTEYDENYNETVKTNPVEAAKITWYTDDTSITLTTDASGKINIPEKYLTNGSHKITIEKYSENGVPQVLRFAPDYAVEIDNDTDTSDNQTAILYILLASAALIVTGTAVKSKRA